MRLLSIFSSTSRGGAENYALTIATAAVQQGWETHVAFPQAQTNASLVQDFQKANVQYHPLDIAEGQRYPSRILDYLSSFLRTIAILIKIKPDVVQITMPWSGYCFSSILACGFLKLPTVIVFQLFPDVAIFPKYKLKLYAWARSRHQQWVGVSEHNCKQIAASFKIALDQVRCIYNGAKFETTDFPASEIAMLRQQVRQRLGLSPTSQIAITVGRLAEQKGYHVLIPAIPQLVKEFPDLQFVWVGDGEQKDQLKQQVREHGIENQVHFLGYRKDVRELLSAADIFVFSTLSEGQPFALIEAMAQGLPIVSSDACGIPELIQHRIHGMLVQTGESDELREAIRWLLQHPQEGQFMAAAAKQHVKKFSEARMIDETMLLFREISSAIPDFPSAIVS